MKKIENVKRLRDLPERGIMPNHDLHFGGDLAVGNTFNYASKCRRVTRSPIKKFEVILSTGPPTKKGSK